MSGQAFGVIGLEVMGRNLALNVERNGYPIAVYNRTYAKTEHFINELAKGKNAKGAKTIQEFVQRLSLDLFNVAQPPDDLTLLGLEMLSGSVS